uniref:F-box domain-containing protein n=1 Tax=Poecilia mexicana TaxID=48701 RepID=A0A3B3XH62_9TELE
MFNIFSLPSVLFVKHCSVRAYWQIMQKGDIRYPRATTVPGIENVLESCMSRFLFCRLPLEILDKILSYLDAYALFNMSHTNKLFYQLASNNVLWKKLYIADICNNEKQKARIVNVQLLSKKTRDHAAGYWKELHVKTVAHCEMKKWKRLLGPINSHTGLPSQTEQVLRNLRVTWELTVTDMSGRESTLELSWSRFSETSLTLCWCGGDRLPNYEEIFSLQLHGVRRIAFSCPSLKKLRQLQHPDGGSVAFIIFTLHFYKLVERSTRGSHDWQPIVQPPFDDIDPEYGLHGYKLHIVLHNTVCKLMSESFSQLFSHISDGWIQLTAISRADSSQHIQLSGKPVLPWRCEALQGTVENCCIMSLTLLDEFGNQFGRVTTPISMEPEEAAVSYDYDGEHYLIQHEDSNIQAKMQLVKMTAKKYFVVSLVVYVSVLFVNKHFSRDY